MSHHKGGGGGGGRDKPREVHKFNGVFKDVKDVKAIEDASYKSNPEKALQSLKIRDSSGPPQRPAFGTTGASVVLRTNHWTCSIKPDQPWHRYSANIVDIAVQTEIPKGRKLANIINKLINVDLKGTSLVSDYSSIILSTQRLKDEGKEFAEKKYEVLYKAEGALPTTVPKKYQILVKYNNTFYAHELVKYLEDTHLDIAEYPNKQDVIQAMNIIVANGMRYSTNIVSDLREHFPILGDTVESRSLGIGLNVFRGFVFSVRAATGRLLLNAQVKHLSAYRGTGPVELGQRQDGHVPHGPGTLEILLKELKTAKMTLEDQERFIKGLSVKLTHFTPPRPKRILGFAHVGDGPATKENPNPVHAIHYGTAQQVRFYLKDKKMYTTVDKYFHDTYRQRSSDSPVVNIGTKADPKYMLASLCRIHDGEEYSKKLDPKQTGEMISMAVRWPDENAQSIERTAKPMIDVHAEQMSEFGCSIGSNLVEVVGRNLPKPGVLYGTNSVSIFDGGWNLRKMTFSTPKAVPKWSFVRIRAPNDRSVGWPDLQEWVKKFSAELKTCGLQATEYVAGVQLILDLDTAKHLQQIKDLFAKVGELRMLLVILPGTDIALYNAVKTAGDVNYGLHTVCVVESKFCKKFSKDENKQYYGNVALKFNLKLGGTNQKLGQADLSFIAEKKTMIVGYDVTHPAAGQDTAPSIAGMVASIDGSCAQWPAVVSIQPGRQEMVDQIQEMFKTRLQLWKKQYGIYPLEVLIYRDGVSEGQYQIVLDEELPKIRAACKELYLPTSTEKGVPKITLVIVGKRHNVRFYPTVQANSHRGNPQHGTVIDRCVTETRVWDFYLQSHAALQGTARPAHYVVLLDEIFRDRAKVVKKLKGAAVGQYAVNDLQLITHNLCYMYGRATKAVSICPPAYYADIACERARRWLSKYYTTANLEQGAALPTIQAADYTVHANLRDTMFYI